MKKDFDFKAEKNAAVLVGRVLLPREIGDLPIFKTKPFDPGRALVDLFLIANIDSGTWRANNGHLLPFKPGDVLWSEEGLAVRWGWSRPTVRKFLKALAENEVITLLPQSNGHIIRLLDYSVYNSVDTSFYNSVDTEGGTSIVESNSKSEGEEAPPPSIPSFSPENVLQFGRSWPGDLLMNIPGTIPDPWLVRYMEWRKKTPPPTDWTDDMISRFKVDYLDASSPGYESARGATRAAGAPGRLADDPAWFWDEPPEVLESALGTARQLGNERRVQRLSEVIAARKAA